MSTLPAPVQSQPDPMLAAFEARARQNAAPVPAAPAQNGVDPMLAAFQARAAGQTTTKPTGPTISAQPQIPTFGESWQTPGERLSMPLVKGLVGLHDKLREIENFTQEGRKQHPIQAHVGDLANRIEGLLIGNPTHPEAGIGTGEMGILTNPITAAILPGGQGEAAEPALAGGLREAKEGIAALREGAATARAGEEGPGFVKQVLKGKQVAQMPAKMAIRTATGAEEETPLLETNKTLMDEPLNELAQREKAAYKKLDEAAGFDVKETRAKLRDAEYKLKQPEIDDATRNRLQRVINESKGGITKAESKMAEQGIDPREADILHKQRMAGQEFKKALIQNVSPDGESVNVDGLLKASKKLRFGKFGDRLEQFMGKDGADRFMADLQKAQELGAHSMKVQEITKRAAKYALYGLAGAEAGRIAYEASH
jgi:hypothetical protein